jgi:SAM-dependent methyltransferase
MRTLDRCPVCDSGDHELVAEYNGLLAHDEMRPTDLSRYEYRLCKKCGTTFASNRPTGPEYELLYSRFNEMLGRGYNDLPLAGGPLTASIEAEISAKPFWWSLSEAAPTALTRSIRKEVTNQTAHLGPIAASSFKPLGSRVLEIRSKSGFLASYLTRVLGAREACVMTTWPTQRAVVERLYGLPCVDGAEKERLSIPFDGTFDLIIAPHVYIHSAEPHQFFDEVRRVLNPGGYLYLCQEPDDTRLFDKGKNLFCELKCFHFQQIDQVAQGKALEHHGFRVIGQGYRGVSRASAQMWSLGQLKKVKPEPLSKSAIDQRSAMYRRWRDESILALPDHLRAAFSDELGEISRRAISAGYAKEVNGRVQTEREVYMVYEDGYEQQNAATAAQD